MSIHRTYRGKTIDMDSMRRENEKIPAIGNMRVNAKGDQLAKGNVITKTTDQLARENYHIQSNIVDMGLKGAPPDTSILDLTLKKPTTHLAKKTKEIELPTGDIIIKGADNES